jgi:hypothetical protein
LDERQRHAFPVKSGKRRSLQFDLGLKRPPKAVFEGRTATKRHP